MTIAFIYWLIMLLILLFGGGWTWYRGGDYGIGGVGLLLYILLFLLGWKVFGWPIQG